MRKKRKPSQRHGSWEQDVASYRWPSAMLATAVARGLGLGVCEGGRWSWPSTALIAIEGREELEMVHVPFGLKGPPLMHYLCDRVSEEWPSLPTWEWLVFTFAASGDRVGSVVITGELGSEKNLPVLWVVEGAIVGGSYRRLDIEFAVSEREEVTKEGD